MLHCYWNGSAWTSENILNAGLQPGVFAIRNRLYSIASGGTRVFITGTTTNTPRFRFGNPIVNPYFPYPDPILYRQDILSILLPDGDTPQVFEFGNHARAIAS